MKRQRGGKCLFWMVLVAMAGAAMAAEPPSADLQQRIDTLIRQLGDDDYFVRERAQDELARLGFETFDALSIAEHDPDPEVQARARYLLRSMEIPWSTPSAPPLVRQAMGGYEGLDEAERRERIELLGDMGDEAAVAALCRVARFERSHVLSKWAAVTLIDLLTRDEAEWSRLSQVAAEHLAPSRRPAAAWVKAYLVARERPGDELPHWTAIARDEETVWTQTPQLTSGEIVLSLLQTEVALLSVLDRRDEAADVIGRSVDVDLDEPAALEKLTLWLAEQQSWDALDRLTDRFAARFQHDPQLIYALAHARQLQGDLAAVEMLTARALALEPGDSQRHLETAVALQHRGWFDWAEAEYRLVLKSKPLDNYDEHVYQSFWRLSSMLHDLHRHLDAADVLDGFMKEMTELAKRRNLPIERLESSQALWRSRMHFYRACHWADEGDPVQQTQELMAAMERNRLDADVLIAAYRLPDTTPQERERIKRAIEDAAQNFRRQIEQDPESSEGYNQLAWLVANTFGDQAEALRLSQKSLDLNPGHAGHLDTLARCYFAQGDLAGAVKHQELAVRREPHSGQMQRQLEEFRRALAESRGAADRDPSRVNQAD